MTTYVRSATDKEKEQFRVEREAQWEAIKASGNAQAIQTFELLFVKDNAVIIPQFVALGYSIGWRRQLLHPQMDAIIKLDEQFPNLNLLNRTIKE